MEKQSLEIASLRDDVARLSAKLADACSKLDALQGLLPAPFGNAGSIPPGSGLAWTADSRQNNSVVSPGLPEASVDGRTTRAFLRKSNLFIFGLQESKKRTQRHLHIRHDIEAAGELLSWLDPLVSASQILDSLRLGKYSADSDCSLLMKLSHPNDVQSVLQPGQELL